MRILSKLMSVFVILLATISYTANATLILEWDNTSTSSNSTHTGASAKLTMTFSDIGGLVLINMIARNTTGEITSFGDGATSSMLTGIAFDLIVPNEGTDLSNFIPGSFLDTMHTPAINPPEPLLDFGVANDNNFLGGDPNGALPASTEDIFSIKIDFGGLNAEGVENAFRSGFTDGSLNYVARFQAVYGGQNNDASDKLSGGTCCGGDDGGGGGGQEIPEPGTLLLFAVALLAVRYCNEYTF